MSREYGVSTLLDELAADLKDGGYRSLPARRVYIPKPGRPTEQRPLSIPAVRDRVVQAATRIVIEPIFEADFLPCSFGFRPRRSQHDALQVLIDESWRGRRWAAETDIANCFGEIPHSGLMAAIEERISDRHLLKLLRAMLRAGVMEAGAVRRDETGTPQGGVISPCLCNVYLHRLDRQWTERGTGVLVRFADDGVPRTLKEDRCRRRFRRMRCCTRDGGWPSAVALQGEIANHRGVRRSRAGVLSVAERARRRRVRCGSRRRAKANHRRSVESVSATSKTGVESLPWDEPGGSLLTGRVGVRHGWWRERGLGSRVELGNLSPRSGGRPVEWCCPAAGRLEREPQAADLRGGE
jgi:hypothetical protein